MADNKGIIFIKYYLQKLKAFFFSKDLLSFLLFLFLSAILWFVNVLGKERETTFTIPVKFSNVPQNIAIVGQSSSEISVTVKDQGVRLFSYSSHKMAPLNIDIKGPFYQRGELVLSSEKINESIRKYFQLQPTSQIVNIAPDSILLKYETLHKKIVPIKLVSNISLMPQYMYSDAPRLSPSQIMVFGPASILDTLQCVRTKLIELENISDSAWYHCELIPTPKVRYTARETKLSLMVEQFTEKKIQLPVLAINCPPHLTIRTFPAMVAVTFTIGLSQYKLFNNNDIEVYIDYNDIKSALLTKQKLKLKSNKTYITNIRTQPSEVEFILEEN